jgi:hypothetical protein
VAPITDTQSFGLVIRDTLFATARRIPYFSSPPFTVRRNKMLQVQPNQLPYLGVYILDEVMTPDGDYNAGCIRFNHAMRVGFSVIDQHNDHVTLEGKLDRAFWALMNGLWRDQYLMNFLNTYNPHTQLSSPDNVRMEGVTRGVRRHLFGVGTLDQETPIGEMQYDATVFWRADYAPIITDEFLELQLRTGIKPGETTDEMAQRQQVGLDIVFPTEKETSNG